MIASQAFTFIALLAASASTVNAKGCYSGGPKFSDMKGGDVDGAIEFFCNVVKPDGMQGWSAISRCFAFPQDNSGGHIWMAIKNPTSQKLAFSSSDCIAAFKREKNACEHGSEQWALSNYIYIDPNDGKCYENADPCKFFPSF
jgi:hypothetical protein